MNVEELIRPKDERKQNRIRITSPFFLFVSDMRDSCKLINKDANPSEIISLMATVWKSIENKAEWDEKFRLYMNKNSMNIAKASKIKLHSLMLEDLHDNSKRVKLTPECEIYFGARDEKQSFSLLK